MKLNPRRWCQLQAAASIGAGASSRPGTFCPLHELLRGQGGQPGRPEAAKKTSLQRRPTLPRGLKRPQCNPGLSIRLSQLPAEPRHETWQWTHMDTRESLSLPRGWVQGHGATDASVVLLGRSSLCSLSPSLRLLPLGRLGSFPALLSPTPPSRPPSRSPGSCHYKSRPVSAPPRTTATITSARHAESRGSLRPLWRTSGAFPKHIRFTPRSTNDQSTFLNDLRGWKLIWP